MLDHSLLKILAEDVGMPGDKNELGRYFSYLSKRDLLINNLKINQHYIIDPSLGKLIVYLEDNMISEYHFSYESDITRKVILTEYTRNSFDQENGAVVVEGEKDYRFQFGADIDLYKESEPLVLPVEAEVKIYAMCLLMNFYRDKESFDKVANKEPIITALGTPAFFGTKFIYPTGLLPNDFDFSFPSLTYITAEVLDIKKKINTETENEFYVILCNSTLGEFELLCSPRFVNENMIIGGIADGTVLFRIQFIKAIEK